MTFKLLDRTRENTTTVGTGNITFGGAVTKYLAFSAGLSNGDTTPYTIEDGSNWEEGVLTYISASNTCSRAVSASTNSNAAINLSGTAIIFSTLRAADIGSSAGNIPQLDTSGLLPVSTVPSVPTTSTLPVGFSGWFVNGSAGAVANGSTIAGSSLTSLKVSGSTGAYGASGAAVPSGTWKNINGVSCAVGDGALFLRTA